MHFFGAILFIKMQTEIIHYMLYVSKLCLPICINIYINKRSEKSNVPKWYQAIINNVCSR